DMQSVFISVWPYLESRGTKWKDQETALIRERKILLEAIVDLAHKSRQKADAYCGRVVSEPVAPPYLRPVGVWAFIDSVEAFIQSVEALAAGCRNLQRRA